MEEVPEITITANLEGVEQVSIGFERMGDSASNMGRKVADSSKQMDMNYRGLMVTSAGLIGNSVQLGDVMDRMAKGQMDVGRGAVILSMNFLQLGSQLYALNLKYGEAIGLKLSHIALSVKEVAADMTVVASKTAHTAASWALTAAEHARAIAHAVANALAGPVGWAILAGAGAAVGTGLALAATIPSHHYEGVIQETGPYIMAKGQYVSTPGASSSGTTIHIHNLTVQTSSPRDFVDKMRRLGAS
jgi:hypothetical protein